MLKAVPGQNTRPTTDKVKESVFNMIGPYFNGGFGLDLFAGSGGLGIEGLSRGLEKVIFVDRHPKAIETIKSNLDACKLEKAAEVYKNDWKRALKVLIQREMAFRVIWLDPPYKNTDVYTDILNIVNEHQLLEKDGCIVCEHTKDLVLPEYVGGLERSKTAQYGTIGISIYRNRILKEDEDATSSSLPRQF